MTQTINTLVATALNAAHAYGDTIAKLRTQMKGQMSPDQVRTTLLPYVAGYYHNPVTALAKGEGMGLTQYIKKVDGVLVRASVKDYDAGEAKLAVGYEAAKKALQRLTADIVGKVGNQKEELQVPAHIAAAAAKLVQLCAEYEHAGRLLATAVAQAKA